MAKPSAIIASKFPFAPTEGQIRLFNLIDQFLEQQDLKRPTLIIKGYAGTGKTSIVSSLVETLPFFELKSLLLAPTGRAAKVMAGYSGRTAYTLHKKIYKKQVQQKTGKVFFSKQKNYSRNTLFIVDESSMVAESGGLGGNSLLNDLIDFVFQHETNRLVLVGDDAQLPPVGQSESYGLDSEYLQRNYQLDIFKVELTEVMRQSLQSGILYNATSLRKTLQNEHLAIHFDTKSFNDIFRMDREKLEDGLRYAYNKYGTEKSIIVCRSNKMAVQYNRYIRQEIHGFDNEIDAGDYIMVVKNNYIALPLDSPAGFLANGDFVEVMKIIDFEEAYGFRFATLELKLLDYPDHPPFDAKVILNPLYASTPSLTQEENQQLYQAVLEDYADIPDRKERSRTAGADPYLNALQIKFAYALTCHKSQGGQWEAVFVDQGYLKNNNIDRDYVRWLYTAITRAQSELYLMNFQDRFFN